MHGKACRLSAKVGGTLTAQCQFGLSGEDVFPANAGPPAQMMSVAHWLDKVKTPPGVGGTARASSTPEVPSLSGLSDAGTSSHSWCRFAPASVIE